MSLCYIYQFISFSLAFVILHWIAYYTSVHCSTHCSSVPCCIILDCIVHRLLLMWATNEVHPAVEAWMLGRMHVGIVFMFSCTDNVLCRIGGCGTVLYCTQLYSTVWWNRASEFLSCVRRRPATVLYCIVSSLWLTRDDVSSSCLFLTFHETLSFFKWYSEIRCILFATVLPYSLHPHSPFLRDVLVDLLPKHSCGLRSHLPGRALSHTLLFASFTAVSFRVSISVRIDHYWLIVHHLSEPLHQFSQIIPANMSYSSSAYETSGFVHGETLIECKVKRICR